MSDQDIAFELALKEVRDREWAMTRQFLWAHRLKMQGQTPELDQVEVVHGESETKYLFNFPVEGERYFFVLPVFKTPAGFSLGYCHAVAASKVSLRFTSESILPETITEQVGLEPTKSWHLGDIRQPGNGTYSFHNWEFRATNFLSGDFDRKFSQLLDAVEPYTERIAKFLTETGNSVTGYVNVYYEGYANQMWGLHLTKVDLLRLSKLGVDVDIDLYASGPDLPEEV